MELNTKRLSRWTAVLVLVGAMACGYTEQAVDTSAEESAIMALESEWSDRAAAGDVDWIVALHAEDAVQLPPDAPLISGSEALRTAWEGMTGTEGLEVSWSSSVAKVAPSGDMAYDYGTATLTTPDGVAHPMKYLVVWVREGGEWKVAADMFNANEPPTTE